MYGIIIVSHSEKLAEGVRDLINMMAPEVHVVTAGGHNDSSYGVSSAKIRDAFHQMKEEKKVLIFMDLGSAKTSVEDILAEFPKGKYEFMDCPLVEGAVNAAVLIAGNAPFRDVVRAAMESRNAFKF